MTSPPAARPPMPALSEMERELLEALKSAHAHLFTCATKLERCAQAGGNADFAIEALIHPYRAACLEIQKVCAKFAPPPSSMSVAPEKGEIE